MTAPGKDEERARRLYAVYAAARKHADSGNSPVDFDSISPAKRIGWLAAASTVMDDIETAKAAPTPVPMLLRCPSCNTRHIDVGESATKVHHTHACQTCGEVWRPAIVATVGVQFLPGFKNADGDK